ncbi:MAG: LppM family (lipo)protein [Chloroflexota bacterium]
MALLAAIIALIAGCVTVDVESEFEEDGSATHTMAVTIDTSMFGEEMAGEFEPEEDFDELEDAAAEEGFRVEQIQDGDIVGVRISTDVEDNSDLGDVINDIFNAQAEEGEVIDAFSGTFERDGDDYRLDLTVDGDELLQGAGEGMDGGGELEGLDMSTFFEMTYVASLPGEVDEDETNGRVLDDGRVEWELPVSGSETMTAVSSTGGGGSNLALFLVIGIIILGLLAAVVIGFVIFITRRDPSAATAGAPGAGDSPDTVPMPQETGGPPQGQVDPYASDEEGRAEQPTERSQPPPRYPDERT